MSFSEVNFNIDTLRNVVNEYKEQIGSFIGRVVKPIQENPILAATTFIAGSVAFVGIYAFGKYVKNLKEENAELKEAIGKNTVENKFQKQNLNIDSKVITSFLKNVTNKYKIRNSNLNSKFSDVDLKNATINNLNKENAKLKSTFTKEIELLDNEIQELEKNNQELKTLNKKVDEAYIPLSENYGVLEKAFRILKQENEQLKGAQVLNKKVENGFNSAQNLFASRSNKGISKPSNITNTEENKENQPNNTNLNISAKKIHHSGE